MQDLSRTYSECPKETASVLAGPLHGLQLSPTHSQVPGRDEGSHVNLYGRVFGCLVYRSIFGELIGREGEDEISDIKDQCIRSKQMIINSSDITFVTIFHSAICDYSSILSVIQDLKNWYHASQSGFAPLLLCPFLLLMLSFFNHHRIGRGRGSGLCHFPTF